MNTLPPEPEAQFLARTLDRRRSWRLLVAFGIAFVLIGVVRAAAALLLFGLGFVVPATYLWVVEPRRLPDRVMRAAQKAGIIACTPDGLRIERTDGEIAFSWASVVRVTAFKRDLLTTDLVCTLFELSDGRCVEIHEELVGWQRAMGELPERLPGCPSGEDWFATVAFPAFETNTTVLFERPYATASAFG